MSDIHIIQGDARAIPLRDECVQCVVTSPPYWGLRKYAGAQDVIWGGTAEHDHRWASNGMKRKSKPDSGMGIEGSPRLGCEFDVSLGDQCGCGAWRGGFGLEPTIEMYVAHTVEILREIRRVLRPDGVVFWNIGDSYCASPKGSMNGWDKSTLTKPKDGRDRAIKTALAGVADVRKDFGPLKPKDLCLIPERVAIAAQADGWWVRSIIIWAKPNPMPESCTDRPTDAYEHIIMLTKSEHYFWDADAVREPAATDDMRRPYGSEGAWQMDGRPPEQRHGGKLRTHSRGYGDGGPKQRERETEGNHIGWADGCREVLTTRNLRNVWTFPTQPYKGAHFATFPEEIPRRCILAATSERGACATCGAPWKRVTEPSEEYAKHLGKSLGNSGEKEMNEGKARGFGEPRLTAEYLTLGWKPTCKCFPGLETRPCLVLDPFGGSGTTARVAVELNRRAVSLDLAYHDHAEKRTRNVQRRLL